MKRVFFYFFISILPFLTSYITASQKNIPIKEMTPGQEIAIIQLSFDGINTFHCGVGTVVQQVQSVFKELNQQLKEKLHFKLYLLSGDYSQKLKEYSAKTLKNNVEDCKSSGGDLRLIPISMMDQMFGCPEQWEELCIGGAALTAEIINNNTYTIVIAHDTAYAQLPAKLNDLKQKGIIHSNFEAIWVPHATSWSYNGHTTNGKANWPERHLWELSAARHSNPLTYHIGYISENIRQHLIDKPFSIPRENFIPFKTGILLDKYLKNPSKQQIIKELSKYCIPLNKRLIFSIGRANPLKGHDITLEMYRHLCTFYSDIHLVLLAPPSDYMPSYLSLLKKRIKEENLTVTLIDTFDKSLAHYMYQYPNTALVSLLSRMDTQPLVVMESRVNPSDSILLVSNSNRMGNQVQNAVNGFTCSIDGLDIVITDPLDRESAIKSAVEQAKRILDLPEPERKTIIQNGKDLIKKKYDLRTNMIENLKVLFELLNRKQTFNHFLNNCSIAIKDLYHLTDSIVILPIQAGLANAPFFVYSENNEIPIGVLKRVYDPLNFAERRCKILNEIREFFSANLPKIIKNKHGKYISKLNDCYIMFLEYIKHDNRNISFLEMLELTGSFHQKTCSIKQDELLKNSKLKEYLERSEIFNDSFFASNYPEVFSSQSWDQIIEYASYFSSSHFNQIYNALPIQLIHGDNNQSNIVISENVPFLIDLDSVRIDVRILDLASYFRYGGFVTYIKLLTNNTLFETIKNSYGKQTYGLTNQEQGNLPLIVLFSHYDFLSWALKKLKETRENQFLEHIKIYIKQIQTLMLYLPFPENLETNGNTHTTLRQRSCRI